MVHNQLCVPCVIILSLLCINIRRIYWRWSSATLTSLAFVRAENNRDFCSDLPTLSFQSHSIFQVPEHDTSPKLMLVCWYCLIWARLKPRTSPRGITLSLVPISAAMWYSSVSSSDGCDTDWATSVETEKDGRNRQELELWHNAYDIHTLSWLSNYFSVLIIIDLLIYYIYLSF